MSELPVITHIRLYKDHRNEYRFTAKAANNRTVTTSSESYKNHDDILGAITSLFPNATINDETKAT